MLWHLQKWFIKLHLNDKKRVLQVTLQQMSLMKQSVALALANQDDLLPPASKRPAIATDDSFDDDIANVVSRRDLSDSDKYGIVKNHFKTYCFPKNSDGRSFQHQRLRQFAWLVYSRRENGLPCVLSSIGGYHSSEPGLLVSKPLTNFKKALEMLRKHSTKEHHLSSRMTFEKS